MGYQDGGLEERFIVSRVDGKPVPADRRYLVLDFSGSDPHARAALRGYAKRVAEENPEFARQLLDALDNPKSAAPQHRG